MSLGVGSQLDAQNRADEYNRKSREHAAQTKIERAVRNELRDAGEKYGRAEVKAEIERRSNPPKQDQSPIQNSVESNKEAFKPVSLDLEHSPERRTLPSSNISESGFPLPPPDNSKTAGQSIQDSGGPGYVGQWKPLTLCDNSVIEVWTR